MRIARITCDRCGKEIAGNPISIIPVYTDRETQYAAIDTENRAPQAKTQGSKDYCENCTIKILEYANTPAGKEKVKKEVAKKETQAAAKAKASTVKDTTEKKERKKLDMGKVMALKEGGWTNKQIAEEMGTTENTIAVELCRYRKKLTGGGNERS